MTLASMIFLSGGCGEGVSRHGSYYLFLSFNHCCKGEETRYQVRAGRSKVLTGLYSDIPTSGAGPSRGAAGRS